MKLHLTKEELLALVSQAMGRDIEDIIIAKGNPSLYDKINKEYFDLGLTDQFGSIRPEEKIRAIKYFRSKLSGCGLAEAKYVIEHWQEYLRFLKENRRLPKIVHLNGFDF